MSHKRELGLAQQDLFESVGALLETPVLPLDDSDERAKRFVEAFEGVYASHRHLKGLLDDLNGEAPASGRDTSIAAAASITPNRMLVLEAIVARFEMSGQGMTCEQVERQLRRPHTSISSIVNYLMNHAFIEERLDDNGLFVRHRNMSGSRAKVWFPTDKAIARARKEPK